MSAEPENVKPFYTLCGYVVKAKFPHETQTGYPPHISALIVEISGIHGNNRETVRNFCQSVLGISISISAFHKIIDRASEALKPAYDKIGETAHHNDINYIDETSRFQNGALN